MKQIWCFLFCNSEILFHNLWKIQANSDFSSSNPEFTSFTIFLCLHLKMLLFCYIIYYLYLKINYINYNIFIALYNLIYTNFITK